MNKFMDNRAFTLIELMVVVAVIGILSAVAVPTYKKYSAQSRTTEAKIKLSTVFAAEQVAYADWGTYANCFVEMGIDGTSHESWETIQGNPTQYAEILDLWKNSYYLYGFDVRDNNDVNFGNGFVRLHSTPSCTTDVNGGSGGPSSHVTFGKTSSPCIAKWNGNHWGIVVTNHLLQQNQFRASAAGYIGQCPFANGDLRNLDTWTIDHTKKLLHTVISY